jgi:hypothetical protein
MFVKTDRLRTGLKIGSPGPLTRLPRGILKMPRERLVLLARGGGPTLRPDRHRRAWLALFYLKTSSLAKWCMVHTHHNGAALECRYSCISSPG